MAQVVTYTFMGEYTLSVHTFMSEYHARQNTFMSEYPFQIDTFMSQPGQYSTSKSAIPSSGVTATSTYRDSPTVESAKGVFALFTRSVLCALLDGAKLAYNFVGR